jgi:hypothetical protein
VGRQADKPAASSFLIPIAVPARGAGKPELLRESRSGRPQASLKKTVD